MAIKDIQLKNSNGEFESIFPLSITQGGTGATSEASIHSKLHLVTYDYYGSNSKMTAGSISQQAEANQPIRIHAKGAAGNYLVYFNKSGTIGLWDVDASSTIWSIRQWPVGSIYMSFSSTSPASLFGGTWSQISGRFLYCTTNTDTGGNNTHTLTNNQLPKLGTQIWNFCGQSSNTALSISTPSGYTGIGSHYGDSSMYYTTQRESWSHTDGFRIAFGGGAKSQQYALLSRCLLLEENCIDLIEVVNNGYLG